MTGPDVSPVPIGRETVPISPGAFERLGELLTGLDRLDALLALPQSPNRSEEGVPFAHFTLRSRIGAGRFGIVLLADDTQLQREVVVKVPQPAVLADPSLRDRFIREARAAAMLQHPGIVSVMSTGFVDGLPFLAASYVAGPSLSDWRRQHPDRIPPRAAARFIHDITIAMQHAHERGVLHCDLAPSNILLQEENSENDGLSKYAPVITDFGLARIVDDDPSLTRTYQIAGTPLYMAPEQAAGDRRGLTARTDIYAIGSLLYELLVGHPPFSGDTMSILNAVITRSPEKPRRQVPQISRDLEAICLKCLEKSPSDRYRSALELAEDLDRFLLGRTVSARALHPLVRCGRWLLENPFSALRAVAVVAVITTAISVAVDRQLKEMEARNAFAIQSAELKAVSIRALSAEHEARTAEFYSTLETVRRRRLSRPPGWVEQNDMDLKRLRVSDFSEEIVRVRSEAAAVAGGTDLGERRDLGIGFRGYDVAFSPDGDVLAVGGFIPTDDGQVPLQLISIHTGAVVRELVCPVDSEWEARAQGRREACWSVMFDPTGTKLVAGTRSGWIAVWDLSQPGRRRSNDGGVGAAGQQQSPSDMIEFLVWV
ncbi:MAG: serine/threonine-protein kinase [Planctomycetaceae bacterium]